MQPGSWVRLPGVQLLQDAGADDGAADGTPAFLVPVLVIIPNGACIFDSCKLSRLRIAPCRILLAFLTTLESVADGTVSWLPLYGEAKLALVVYLWHPNTMASNRLPPSE
jgi:hypothetical protein